MSYGQIPKANFSLEDQGLKKISQFITRFHSILLPRANNRGVYRDLTEDEDYLLSNLGENTLVHSVLAGCLAIDSCLTNIFEAQKVLTFNIMKDLTLLLNNYRFLEGSLGDLQVRSKQHRSNQNIFEMQKLQSFSLCNKKIGEDLRVLTHHLHQLNFAKESQQISKQNQIFQSAILPKKTSDIPNAEKQLLIQQILQQNADLKQQLVAAQKKVGHLQTRLVKATQKATTLKKQNSSTDDILKLQEEIQSQKKYISQLQFQHSRQKNYLNREIMQLEDELRAVQKYADINLISLLQELQSQIFMLKQQRKHDQRIINSIQHKMQFLNINGLSKSRHINNYGGIHPPPSRMRASNTFMKSSQFIRPSTQYEDPNEIGDKTQRSNTYASNDTQYMRKSALNRKNNIPISYKNHQTYTSKGYISPQNQNNMKKSILRNPGQTHNRNFKSGQYPVQRQQIERPRQLHRYKSGQIQSLAMSGTFGQANIHQPPQQQQQAAQNTQRLKTVHSDSQNPYRKQLFINQSQFNIQENYQRRRANTKYT